MHRSSVLSILLAITLYLVGYSIYLVYKANNSGFETDTSILYMLRATMLLLLSNFPWKAFMYVLNIDKKG